MQVRLRHLTIGSAFYFLGLGLGFVTIANSASAQSGTRPIAGKPRPVTCEYASETLLGQYLLRNSNKVPGNACRGEVNTLAPTGGKPIVAFAPTGGKPIVSCQFNQFKNTELLAMAVNECARAVAPGDNSFVQGLCRVAEVASQFHVKRSQDLKSCIVNNIRLMPMPR